MDQDGKELEKDPNILKVNQFGIVQFEILRPAYITQYKTNPAFARIILRDNNTTMGFGQIQQLYSMDIISVQADMKNKLANKRRKRHTYNEGKKLGEGKVFFLENLRQRAAAIPAQELAPSIERTDAGEVKEEEKKEEVVEEAKAEVQQKEVPRVDEEVKKELLEQIKQDKEKVAEKHKQFEEDFLTCKICLNNRVNAAFYNCGHTICFECTKPYRERKNKHCHQCRQEVMDVVRLFF